MRILRWVAISVGIGLGCSGLPIVQADEIDDVVAEQMREHHIPGLSLAIVLDGKVVRSRGYGWADEDRKIPVTSDTRFQAGSISKAVAAVGVLHLVDKRRIDLDADVNSKLRSWKLPENEFAKEKKVTVRWILCHGAGLTVHGFPGYAIGRPIPTLLEVLDGVRPANTAAIRVDMAPGSKWRYSGGGYVVLQQLLMDVTGKAFPTFMDETVLKPLGMKNSTFEQPLPVEKRRLAAVGYRADGKAVGGGWHVYPEMAAAGLWTTASDMARFEIAIQRALAGNSNSVLSQSMAREMVTKQLGDCGLGVFVAGKKDSLVFYHEGRDEGFDADFVATANTGKGAVVLMNKNDDSGAIGVIVKAIAKKFSWP